MTIEALDSEARTDPLSPNALHARLTEIVAFGSRFTGSPGEAQCRAYLMQTFQALGLSDVGLEPFAHLGYTPVSARCTIEGSPSHAPQPLPCVALQSTADARATGVGVFVGDGSTGDIAAARERCGSLAGRIVITQTSNLFATVDRLRTSGIAGLVVIAPTASGLIAAYTAALYPPPLAPPWPGRILPFPGVTIEADAGRALVALMTSGPVTLTVEHRARYEDAEAANVIAEVPGVATGGETVIVGAHYDTQLDCPGAWDNGSGVASLLQIAADVVARPCSRTVRFVAFTVEEPGLWGSTVHARGLEADAGAVTAMINLDTVGSPIGGPRVLVASPEIAEIALGCATSAGWPIDESEHPDEQRYFDHTPFADAGVPVACFLQSRLPHPYYHSPGDTLDLIDSVSMAAAARAAAATVRALAQSA